MKALLLASTVAVTMVLANGVAAQDYKAEITRFVVDPCYTALIREHDMAAVSGLSEKDTLDTVKALAESEIDEAMLNIFKSVNGEEVRYRMDMYKLAKKACIEGLLQ